MSNKSLTKNVSKVSTGTFLSRITGLFRDITITHFLGATWVADSFGVAFMIPNMLRGLFGEGALAAAFIPLYTEYREKKGLQEAQYFAVNVFSILIVLLCILTSIGMLVTPLLIKLIVPGFSPEAQALTARLTQFLFPYLFLIGMTSIFIAVLNTHGVFFWPSLSPMLLNLGIIIPVVVYSLFFESTISMRAYIFAIGVLIGGFLQLVVNLRLIRKIGYSFRFIIDRTHKGLRIVWQRIVPCILGLGIREVNVLVDAILGSLLAAGSVAALQYGNRLMQLPLGVFGIAIGTAALPLFSLHSAAHEKEKLRASIQEAFLLILFIMLPVIAIILTLGKDMIALIYFHGEFGMQALLMTFAALAYYSIGLIGHSAVKIFAAAFFALGDTKTPVRISIIAVILNIILNIVLMYFLQLRGLALATSLAAIVQSVLLYKAIYQKIGSLNGKLIFKNGIKLLIAACVAGMVAFFFQKYSRITLADLWIYRFGMISISFFAALISYWVMAYLLRISTAITITQKIRVMIRR